MTTRAVAGPVQVRTPALALSGLTAGTTYYWQVAGEQWCRHDVRRRRGHVILEFHHHRRSGGVRSQQSGEWRDGTVKQSDAELDCERGCGELRLLLRHDERQCVQRLVRCRRKHQRRTSGLVAGATYYWQVRAVNGGGMTYANGAATAFWSFTTTPMPRPIVDLNGDGNGDVLTYNPSTGAWARQVTLTGGGFSTTLGNWQPGWTVTPVRFNADALTDFFLFNPNSGAWSKLINNGTGFTTQATGVWWHGWQRDVMDFDGDGDSDIFLYDPATGQWFKSLSTPTGFDYVQGAWNAGWEIYPMALNSDARGDMFLFDRTTGRWFWVLSEADGSFTYPQVGYWATDWMLHAGDFDGDGRGDWFLYRPDAGNTTWHSTTARGIPTSRATAGHLVGS